MLKTALFLFLLVTASAIAKEKPADAVAYLVKQMGGTEVHLAGLTPEMMFPCGVDFAATDGALRATFYNADGGAKDVRATFDLGPKSKIKLFDAEARTVVADNVYVERIESGRTRKSTYRARMEVALDNAGKIRSVNLGWNRDRQDPLMYRCVFQ